MQNKLQELTDKLYNEGLSKGKAEAEQMKANASKEAEKIIAKAKEDAGRIMEQAKKDAADLMSKCESDIKMSSAKAISALRKEVENLIVAKAVDANVDKSLKDGKFIEKMITSIVSSFNAANPQAVELQAILPENMKSELATFVSTQAADTFNKGVSFTFSKAIEAGFQIGPKDGSYILSFTDADLQNVISQYLRPTTKSIVFGK